jgi:hypothetical protein
MYAPQSPTGPPSVGGQHHHYFNSIAWNEMQVWAFWVDLSRQVSLWKIEGEKKILLVDANTNLRSEAAMAQIASIGLR